jgi:hypothetical protein
MVFWLSGMRVNTGPLNAKSKILRGQLGVWPELLELEEVTLLGLECAESLQKLPTQLCKRQLIVLREIF